MTVFNRTFFDLNEKRGYCVDGADGLPPDTVSDLKISVPHRTEPVRLAGLFLHGESVRLLLAGGAGPVASFTSDRRSAIRTGEPYPLTGIADGYGGLIVFGEGIRGDGDYRTPLRISEECLTRYEKSAIPYAAVTCRTDRLTGEILLAGSEKLVSGGIDVDPVLFRTKRALRLALVDTGVGGPGNPMIATANGINGEYGQSGTAVVKLLGAVPNAHGEIFLRFDDHFHFAPVGDPGMEPSILALGTDVSVDDLCERLSADEEAREETNQLCKPSDIEIETIPYG